jgi:hypothetical protein
MALSPNMALLFQAAFAAPALAVLFLCSGTASLYLGRNGAHVGLHRLTLITTALFAVSLISFFVVMAQGLIALGHE